MTSPGARFAGSRAQRMVGACSRPASASALIAEAGVS